MGGHSRNVRLSSAIHLYCCLQAPLLIEGYSIDVEAPDYRIKGFGYNTDC